MWHFLVILTGVGNILYLARSSLRVYDGANTQWLSFRDALSSIDVPDLGEDDGGVSITVSSVEVPTQELRDAGILLGDASAEVSMWKEGTDFRDRIVLLTGAVEAESIQRYQQETRIQLNDNSTQLQRPFPPWSFQRQLCSTDSLGNEFYYGFSDLPDSEQGKAINVIIGTVKDVPLTLVDRQEELPGPIPFGLVVPVSPTGMINFRWVLAGHRLHSTSVKLKADGEGTRFFYKDIQYARDPVSGAEYAYIECNNTEEGGVPEGASSLAASEVRGHVDEKGKVITGLGDAVILMLKIYSGLEDNQIDYERLSRFMDRANKIKFSGAFGGSSDATLLETLKSRLESQFPIKFSFRGGRFGADWLLFEANDPAMKRLRYGGELIERVEPVVMNNDQAISDVFIVEYDPNTYGSKRPGVPSFRQTIRWENPQTGVTVDTALERLRGHKYPRSHPVFELVDVNDGATATLIRDGLKQLYGTLRTKVIYLAHIDDVIHLPLMEKYLITDSDMYWDDEPFRLDKIKLREDGLAEVTLVSYNEAP